MSARSICHLAMVEDSAARSLPPMNLALRSVPRTCHRVETLDGIQIVHEAHYGVGVFPAASTASTAAKIPRPGIC